MEDLNPMPLSRILGWEGAESPGEPEDLPKSVDIICFREEIAKMN